MSDPRVRTEAGFERTWPGASALATECILNLGFLAGQLQAFGVEQLHAHGIPSTAAFNVLTILDGATQPLLPSTIAERMVVTRPTMTGVVQTLERRGLVQRTAPGADRRRAPVEITAEGRKLVRRVLPLLHEAEKRWMSCLTEEEQRTLLALVGRLQANPPPA